MNLLLPMKLIDEFSAARFYPSLKPHPLEWEAELLLLLSPAQHMCYFNGILFGGDLSLFMNRILTDYSKPAVTAYLNTCYVQWVPPTTPILLRSWPDRVHGPKIYLI